MKVFSLFSLLSSYISLYLCYFIFFIGEHAFAVFKFSAASLSCYTQGKNIKHSSKYRGGYRGGGVLWSRVLLVPPGPHIFL